MLGTADGASVSNISLLGASRRRFVDYRVRVACGICNKVIANRTEQIAFAICFTGYMRLEVLNVTAVALFPVIIFIGFPVGIYVLTVCRNGKFVAYRAILVGNAKRLAVRSVSVSAPVAPLWRW